MAQMTDAELQLLEQFGGSADPKYVVDSSLDGDRVTDAFGYKPGSIYTADMGGVVQGGGARRNRRRLTRRRKTRSSKAKGRGRNRLAFNMRISFRRRQRQNHRQRS